MKHRLPFEGLVYLPLGVLASTVHPRGSAKDVIFREVCVLTVHWTGTLVLNSCIISHIMEKVPARLTGYLQMDMSLALRQGLIILMHAQPWKQHTFIFTQTL